MLSSDNAAATLKIRGGAKWTHTAREPEMVR